jgi:acyl carrier protein
MTEADIRDRVLHILGNIAPEADLSKLDSCHRIRDQLDLDSMDFLNFVIGLHEDLRVDIPERDYGLLASVEGCVKYLMAVQPLTP